ncbi:MAG TPA: enoyl-CoA hydratase/isomerase family protein [Acidimicrobiales bacterium]|jgi:enoyl-CoA hydratase/carnithine racemase|nr:enoyl-CoA hydratase/isomerase family protein [Acidimicrobiales bacterium]
MTAMAGGATELSSDGATAGTTSPRFGDVTVEIGDDFVATVWIHRPPNNYFDVALIRSLADAYQALDADPGCRAIVLGSEGKHFCAGANFSTQPGEPDPGLGNGGVDHLYTEAARLFEARTPVVAAVQGAAIGGGLGLACSADFRVAEADTRFAANFAQLGFHHGFALTATLPPIVGQQRSWEMLLTGRRVSGEEAARIGLCDRSAGPGELLPVAHGFAAEIAASAPLALTSIRETIRGDLADRVRAATLREAAEQAKLFPTADFAEGVRATAERRPPRFEGR